jgi:hypothetical protein
VLDERKFKLVSLQAQSQENTIAPVGPPSPLARADEGMKRLVAV